MVDRGVVLRKVAAIRDAVERVREVTPPQAEAFLADRGAREIVVLNLFVGLQEALDLAAHWLSDEGRRIPEEYRDVFLGLVEARVLDAGLAARLARAAGLRNLVAHRYGTIEWARVHAIATTEIADLEAFCAAMAASVGE